MYSGAGESSMNTQKWNYMKGLHDLGDGCYAYLQPDGAWGWSNAGLVADRGESLLVDTLFDLKLTREMLDTMRRAEPDAHRVMYTGDILFIEGHPIIWQGPIRTWIAACQLIIDADVDVIVPGHGPITDKKGVAALKGYFEYIEREARRRYDAGMTVLEAARDISLADYSSWGDAERIIVNVASLYREFSAGKVESNIVELFTMMAQLRRDRRK